MFVLYLEYKWSDNDVNKCMEADNGLWSGTGDIRLFPVVLF